MPFLKNEPTKGNLIASSERIASFIHKTPILTSGLLNDAAGCNVYFKCENFQKAGSFKFRGATNAILSLNNEERKMGVITHSSGNHAAAIAKSASIANIKCVIVMPNNAPKIKIDAVKNYGAEIVFCEPTIKDREETANSLVEKHGYTLIHPFDNYSIIAGQATVAMEILDELEEPDYIVTPVGGGGLASGSCLSAKHFGKSVKIIGAEPAGADDAFLSLRDKKLYPQNNPQTVCDGLRTPLSKKTFDILSENILSVITVEDKLTVTAMRLIMERMKIVVEPSAAITFAAVIKKKPLFSGKNICVILSGGNVDLNRLPF